MTLTWSWLVAVFPGLTPPTSISRVAPAPNEKLPVFKIPGLFPGATVAPLLTVSDPPNKPLPPIAALLFTVMLLALEIEPLTSSAPALIVVAPVYVFAPLRVCVPVPTLLSPSVAPPAPAFWITPLNAPELPSAPTVKTDEVPPGNRRTVPLPFNASIVSEAPTSQSVPSTSKSDASGITDV